MLNFRVDQERCIQCGECAEDCPTGVITLDDYPQLTNEGGCIQCQHCLAICPTAALSILDKDPDASTSLAGNLPDPAQLTTLIKGRRSIRRYRERDLDPEVIDELLHKASHAPTGVNAQGVLFTVIKQRAELNKLHEAMIARLDEMKKNNQLPTDGTAPYLKMVINGWQEKGQDVLFRGAPHLLITSSPSAAPCPVQDNIIALANFELLAQSHGVGAVWDGIFMMALAACPELVPQLGIPANHTLGYAMAFGAPAVEYQRTVQRGPALINEVQL
ncbi:MAG: nitroreductase family protein [Desulfurivibrio sp.]|nr:nitroreductase family protein [Desulfurivibrio sp.]